MARVGEGRRTMLVPVEHQQEEGGVARSRREGGSGLEDRAGEASSASSRTSRVGSSLSSAARIASRAASGDPVPAGVEDRRPGALYLDRELGREPGLADAARAADERSSGAPSLSASAQRLRSQRSSRSRPARSGEPPSS